MAATALLTAIASHRLETRRKQRSSIPTHHTHAEEVTAH
jgi:hypothetical protein